ncbi:unnamed protein product [Moneuplotes crassus]|uniref:CS domain-containing protein n=1 Tax=Euplotes crassus TaxID=5936 RepID=A0A7S3KFN5_EUPCR|nr:unnamed protein product [Moneuplotes crassus]CAI2380298.1 unnamed protein product [Moneuplotes crassus]|mmetsp:Transcript_25191/g.24951  ORF Transcript_25191/g.24951 Transcript_25191/m.24951 type:complete len:183 (+) Transcript_25191:13-561(+)
MESSDVKFPDLKWAQRSDRLLVTIDLPGAKNTKIDLNPAGHLKFTGEVGPQKYAMEMDLYKEIILEESKWNLKGRNVILNIVKKDQEDEYWPRITKEKIKHPHIKIDWAKWVDEEEQNEAPAADYGDFDPDKMNEFGMGDYEDSDDDEEEEVEDPKEAVADLDDLDAEEEADNAPKTQEASA